MVASSGHEIYSTFQHDMNPEEGARSSGESSGLQSPTHRGGTSFSPTLSDSFRDQLEAQGAAAIIAPQYDYASLTAQQPPLLEISLQMSRANAHTAAYPDYYTVSAPPRSQISPGYSVQQLPHAPGHSGRPVESRYAATSERRLPSGPSSHDSSQPGQTRTSAVLAYGDQKPPMSFSAGHQEPAMNTAPSGDLRKSQKKTTSTTAVIACRQCRGRKIRCDSTRPVCNNCVRRSNVCEYDLVPKRRGPDKNPGTRHRRCKRRTLDDPAVLPPPLAPPLKRRRTTADRDRSLSSNDDHDNDDDALPPAKRTMPSDRLSPQSHLRSQHHHPVIAPDGSRGASAGSPSVIPHDHSPTSCRQSSSYAAEETPQYGGSTVPQVDVSGMRSPQQPQHTQRQKHCVGPSQAVQQTQRMWWDSFLEEYPLAQIEQDLRYLFADTGHWLCFLNFEHFSKRLLDAEARVGIQPALVYAGLAMATLMKSSEVEYKAPGRERALWLRDSAVSCIQSSISAEWVDAALAEAALIIALFESSVHPMYDPGRVEEALVTLDYIIRTTRLTTIDADDADVLTYPAGHVPMAPLLPLPATAAADPGGGASDRKCGCIPADAAQAPDAYTLWSYIPAWDARWTEEEVRDEECRRLCWAALSLVCNYVSQCVAFDREPPELFILDCANYAILFPGEALDRVSPTFRASTSSTKESVWALYCRSMLLWNFTNRLRTRMVTDGGGGDEDKIEVVYDAWAEAQALQDALGMHTCNLDTVLMYMCREYVYNTQITITQTLRSLQGLGSGPPIFNRKQAEEWLWYQDRVIQIVRSAINELGGAQGYQLTRRPYQVTWFTNQLSICLLLWSYDRSLKNALVLAKSILVPVEVMARLWPCEALKRQLEDLRNRLSEACTAEGMEPPTASGFSIEC